MPEPGRFAIAELVRRSRTPRATIHHYLKLGLLPSPQRVGRNRFLYDARHVDRLRLIALLRRRRGLRLNAIRSILPDLVRLEGGEAFRPEMWEQVLGRRPRWAGTPATRLLDAATEAFSRYGYADVNVEDLCRRAGIAKGSFYRHYASKQSLFFAAAGRAADEIRSSFRGQPRVGARSRLAGLVRPHAPLFLDLVARGIEGRPGYRRAGREILLGLAEDIGRELRLRDPERSGLEEIFAALASVTGRALAERTGRQAAPR